MHGEQVQAGQSRDLQSVVYINRSATPYRLLASCDWNVDRPLQDVSKLGVELFTKGYSVRLTLKYVYTNMM